MLDPRPLRIPAYRRLWTGNAISFFGYQLTAVAIPVQIYRLTESSLWVGMMGLAAFVPLLIFALWGGALADAVDRRRLLIVASLVTWSSTLVLFLLTLTDTMTPAVLLCLVALQSSGVAISMPTRQAIYPRLVEPELLPAANTLNSTTVQAATVLGPLVAGLIFTVRPGQAGLETAYAIDALLFTVGIWAAWRLPSLPTTGGNLRGGAKAVGAGLRYIAGSTLLLGSFAIDLIAMVLASPRALYPEFVDEYFGGSGAALGWLYASVALGSVVGGLTSGWIGHVRRQGRALVAAVICWGLAVAAAGMARQLWLVVALLAVAGAADLVSSVYRNTMLQTVAPDEMRGRMQGAFTAVVAGGPRLGDLRAGALATIGVGFSWVSGGIVCAIAAALLALAMPTLTRYTRAEAAR
ncbi:MFS transporter [Allocatelliglobosispora scoriae]|nr:MFS transporter [Allocatelliglobosispora scoriae]